MYSLFLICLFILQWVINAGMYTKQEVKCQNRQDPSQLNSFLWTLKRNPPSYFFGTIHVPYTRVWDYIPQNTKVAFEESEDVIFELDLTNPYTISALANCQLLPRGEKLANILPADIYIRLKKHIEYVRSMMPAWMTADQRGMGLYADYLFNAIAGNWERKRPVWVMLMVNSLTESDIKSRGIPVLDLYLAQEAEKIGKVTGAVERVEEQCVPLNELNFSQVVFALNQTLWQHEVTRSAKRQMRYTTEDLIHHYNCGDLNAIIFNHDSAPVPNLVNNSLPPQDLQTAKMIDEYFRDELINKRNERMAERVINLLKAHPHKSFFFAFGAGHFLGNDTVIDKLIRAGYVIEHTPPNVDIPRSKSNRKKKRRRKKFKDRKPYDYTLGDFWFQMDAESRSWFGRHANKNGRKHNRSRDQPFNDLWIRMDNYDPNLLTALAEKFGYPEKNNKTRQLRQEQEDYNMYSSASVVLTDVYSLLSAFVVYLLCTRVIGS